MADDFNQQYGKPLFGASGAWANTGLAGSPPPVAADPGEVPLTGESGIPGVGTTMPLAEQSDGTGAATVNVPAQAALYAGDGDAMVAGIPGSLYGVTGIGKGRTHFGGESAS